MDIQAFLTQFKFELRLKQRDQLALCLCQWGDKLQQKHVLPRDTEPYDQIGSKTKKLDIKEDVLPFLDLKRGQARILPGHALWLSHLPFQKLKFLSPDSSQLTQPDFWSKNSSALSIMPQTGL